MTYYKGSCGHDIDTPRRNLGTSFQGFCCFCNKTVNYSLPDRKLNQEIAPDANDKYYLLKHDEVEL